MFELIIKVVFWFVNNVYGLIFNPIINFLENAFPSLSDLIDNIQYFLITYIFPTLKWTKNFLMNCVAFPQSLFEFLVILFTIMITIHATFTVFEFGLRIYNHFKP